jgi:hypothetical protein
MAHGHSLTTHQMFVYIYNSKKTRSCSQLNPLEIATMYLCTINIVIPL